ncbi:MAG: hypothetical protein ACI9R3_003069 [Verrucomicrobiales bacterium]|jgi:hypothetical protein
MNFLEPAEKEGGRGTFPRPGQRWKWARRLLFAVPILAIVGLIGVNVLLMFPFVKGRIERKISAVVGARTEIGRVTWSPWAGVRAREVTVAAVDEAIAVADVPFFESDIAWVKVRLRSLLKGVLEITEVGIDSPRIACVRAADGRFLLPFAGRPAPVSVDVSAIDSSPAIGEKRIQQATEESDSPTAEEGSREDEVVKMTPPTRKAPVPDKRRTLKVLLGEIVIQEGQVTLLGGGSGKGLGELRDFEMRLNLRGKEPGRFQASGATLLGRLEVEKIAGTVQAQEGGFEFRDIGATWAGGKVVGSANLAVMRPGLPFTVDLQTEGLKPSTFLKVDDSADPATKALLEDDVTVQLRLQGFARALHTVAGLIRLQGFQVPDAALLTGSSMQGSTTENAGMLDFEIAKILFHLSSGGIVLDDVHFNADRVVLRAAGTVSATSELSIAVRTYVPVTAVSAIGAFMNGWPKERLMHFTALDYTPYIYRDVLVRGSLSEPAVDAWNDGTFFTLPALLDEIRELREASSSMQVDAEPAAASPAPALEPVPVPMASEPDPVVNGLN